MSRSALSPADIERRMADLPGWTVADGRLHREFTFDSFAEAFGFMASVAIHAQAMDHHPDWSNSYTTVTVDLMSHDAGGITDRDVRLATIMSGLYARNDDA